MCPTWSYAGYALSHYRIKILQPESMIIDWEGKTSPTDLSPLFLEFTNSVTPSFFFCCRWMNINQNSWFPVAYKNRTGAHTSKAWNGWSHDVVSIIPWQTNAKYCISLESHSPISNFSWFTSTSVILVPPHSLATFATSIL